LLAGMLTTPAMASSNWLEDFLRRYDPSAKTTPLPASPPAPSVGQFLKTGEVPVTINDVVNMMLDNNLDIRANRLAPRSQYLQSCSSTRLFNRAYTGRLTYTGGQHLLQNRGRIVNLRQVLQGQNTEKISEATFELQLTTLIVQAQKSYWDLVFASQDVNLKQR